MLMADWIEMASACGSLNSKGGPGARHEIFIYELLILIQCLSSGDNLFNCFGK